jgi:hypothetical protein
MDQHSNEPAKDIQTILAADHHARHAAIATIENIISHKEAQKTQMVN